MFLAPLCSQVKIHERLEVNPRVERLKRTEALSTVPSLKFSYNWRSSSPARIEVTGPCGEYAVVEGTGSRQNGATIVATISPASIGTYLITMGTIPESPPDLCGEAYAVQDEFGRTLMSEESGPYWCRIDRPSQYVFRYPTGFDLNVWRDTVAYAGTDSLLGEDTPLNLSWVAERFDSCTPRRWLDSDSVTVQIVEGVEFGQFLFFDAESDEFSRGTRAVVGPFDHISLIYLPDGSPPGLTGGKVTLEASALGLVSRKSFIVRDEAECVRILPARLVLSPGDTTLLAFKRINSDGTESDFPPGQRFDVMILSGDDKGMLLSPTGEAATELTGSEAPIRYIAPAVIVGDSITVSIVASASRMQSAAVRFKMLANGVKPPAVFDGASFKTSRRDFGSRIAVRAVEACTQTTVMVRQESVLDHFAVWVSPDTIEHSQSTTITVVAQDLSNREISIYGNTVMTFTTDKPEYGSFSQSAYSTYALARAGGVVFVADRQNPVGLDPQRVVVTVTGAAKSGSGRMNVMGVLEYTHFTQGDSIWADSLYDNSKTERISGKGCALTAIAMVMKAFGVDVDPGSLNKWMKGKDGFDGLNVKWWSIDGFAGNNKVEYRGQEGYGIGYDKTTRRIIIPQPINLTDMDVHLNKGLPIIAQVLNPTTNNAHWVLVSSKRNGEYNILDPGGYSNRTTLSGAYKNSVYRFILYEQK